MRERKRWVGCESARPILLKGMNMRSPYDELKMLPASAVVNLLGPYECPHCGYQFCIDGNYAGFQLACPGCSKLVAVPEEEPETVVRIQPRAEGATLNTEWVLFTKRTNDPKLSWLELRLDAAGIPHRRAGESAHAPITEVRECDLEKANAILWPIDDIEDDNPIFEKRIIAAFHPQAWLNDYAVEVDPEGPVAFDVTAAILAMPRDRALALEDDDDGTDNLRALPSAPVWIQEWGGPFWVEVEDAIMRYFAEEPYDQSAIPG